MSISLYEISKEYSEVLRDLESIEDLDAQVIKDTLEPFKDDLDKKCLSVGAFIKNLQAESDAVKDAENKLKARRATLDKKISSMKAYLCEHLPHKLSDNQTVLSFRAGSKRTIVDDESKLPESCFVISKKVSLTEVKKNIEDLPEGAAHIETGPQTITIK